MKKRLKIFVFTATRSEYGLLFWVLKEFEKDPDVDLHLIVSGTHLSKKYGFTITEIKKEKWKNLICIKTLNDKNNLVEIANSISNGINGLSKIFKDNKPDCLIVLGDRYELFSVMAVCTLFNIPIAHISGGEITEGAIDNQIRNALTKVSHLHFVATENYKKRLLQLGEEKWRVLKTGETGIDNILNLNLISIEQLSKSLGLNLIKKTALVAFHPVTLELDKLDNYLVSLLKALDCFDLQYVFTYPNNDPGSKKIIISFENYVKKNYKNSVIIKSLGQQKFLSLLHYVKLIIGNSSSGIVEAPSLNLPCVNIGNRQKGREFGKNVFQTNYDEMNIKRAIEKCFDYKYKFTTNPYGKGNSSIKVKDYIKEIFKVKSKNEILTKKFVDYDFNYK